jgi:hypothetical protein
LIKKILGSLLAKINKKLISKLVPLISKLLKLLIYGLESILFISPENYLALLLLIKLSIHSIAKEDQKIL